MLERIITITTPPTSRDLTTRETMKDELDIQNAESDDRLDRWITDASDRISIFLGRPLGEAGYQEEFRLDHFEKVLKLSRYPIMSSSAGVAQLSVTDVDGTVLVLGTDYQADLKLGLLFRLSSDTRTHWARGKVTAVYTAGYDLLDDLPRPIEEACIILVKHRFFARKRDPMLTSEEVAGIERQTFWVGGTGTDSGMPPEVEDLLRPFREVRT